MNKALFSSTTQTWTTPKELFDELHQEFGFTCDVAASEDNALCEQYFDESKDGLAQDWFGNVWCNPPYDTSKEWIAKAYNETKKECSLAVLLLPARTDTKAFHSYIYNSPNVEVRFLKGRLKFSNSKNSAPFPSMICIFKKHV